MTIGIYKLSFNNTDLIYIGQSINIEKRFKDHIRILSLNKGSPKLQKAYNEYGLPSIDILCICSLEDLDYYEILYIKEFDSYYRGLNATLGGKGFQNTFGENHFGSSLHKEDYYMIMWYLIQTPTIPAKDIADILEVPYSIVKDISSLNSHCWLEEIYPTEYNKLVSLLGLRKTALNLGVVYPKIISPENRVYEVKNTNEFAKLFGLNQSHLHDVLTGNRPTHKGWHLETYKSMDDYPPIVSPKGEIFIIKYKEAAKFAREHNLEKSQLSDVLSGRGKSHKGWTLHKVE